MKPNLDRTDRKMFLRPLAFLLIAQVVAGAAAQAQVPVPDQSTPPNSASDETVIPVTPTPAAVIPPAVPPRFLPPPPTRTSINQALPLQQPIFVKSVLSWRAKAQELKSDDQAACRVVQGAYDDVFMALIACLPKFNWKVEFMNSNAGEILAAPLDASSNQRIIFTFTEMPVGSVTIKAAPLHSYKQANGTLQNLLQAINPLGAPRGQSL
jgi:hypothetical protein